MLTQQSPGFLGIMFIIEAKSFGKLTKFLFAGPKSIALSLDDVICPPGQSVGCMETALFSVLHIRQVPPRTLEVNVCELVEQRGRMVCNPAYLQ